MIFGRTFERASPLEWQPTLDGALWVCWMGFAVVGCLAQFRGQCKFQGRRTHYDRVFVSTLPWAQILRAFHLVIMCRTKRIQFLDGLCLHSSWLTACDAISCMQFSHEQSLCVKYSAKNIWTVKVILSKWLCWSNGWLKYYRSTC